MTIKLVSDSTCDLPLDRLVAHNVHLVPINIQFGSSSYQENIDLKADAFYKKIKQERVLPKTSQPSVGQFLAQYQQLIEANTEIISIHVTGQLSGTCQSAKLAAEKVADKAKVYVIDSLAGSAGLGWMVVAGSGRGCGAGSCRCW